MRHDTRQVPEIDGSQGAFIGVVVALSVLIVVCCAAVFYLLRHHEPTEQDRAARRERSRRTREHTLNSSSTFVGLSTSTGSLGDKVKQLWQSTTGTGSSVDMGGGMGRGRRGGRGWIRAGSDDEWASHSDQEGGAVGPELGGPLRPLHVLERGTRDGGDGAEAGDGVRVVESPLSDTGSGFAHAHTYTDPYGKTAVHGGPVLHRSQSPLSSPVSSPREESPEVRSPGDDEQLDRRHRSAMSNSSVWTHAGSKFVEDI